MSTKNYAVIGHPISHSLSPFIHELLFGLDHIDASYVALDICDLESEYDEKLSVLSGYNVTIPYKIDIIKKLSKISEKAFLCNSVNTVKNGEIAEGFTTDGYGFSQAVKAKTGGVLPKDVLIYGYGGAARAIAFECLEHGCNISFSVRESSIDNCNKLKDEIFEKLSVTVNVYSLYDIPKDKNFSLLVNATPVGMHPNIDACVASDEIIQNAEAVFDAVYNPLETLLLKKAKEYEKIAIGSVEMLVYQAAKAHEIWVDGKYTDAQLLSICEKVKDKLQNR